MYRYVYIYKDVYADIYAPPDRNVTTVEFKVRNQRKLSPQSAAREITGLGLEDAVSAEASPMKARLTRLLVS